MNVDKVTVSIDSSLLRQLDRLVSSRVFPSRSRAIQEAIKDKLNRVDGDRLNRELEKLTKEDIDQERALANEGLAAEVDQWPPY